MCSCRAMYQFNVKRHVPDSQCHALWTCLGILVAACQRVLHHIHAHFRDITHAPFTSENYCELLSVWRCVLWYCPCFRRACRLICSTSMVLSRDCIPNKPIIPNTVLITEGRDRSVGIATRYGDRILVRARFYALVQTGPGAHPTSCTMGAGSFPGVERPGCGADHPPPSSAEVKERVELYLCFPSGPSWTVLGCTLPLPYYIITQYSRI